MQKIHVAIEFENGDIEEVILRPRSLIAAERKFGGSLPPIEGGLFACFFQLGMPGGERGFEKWLDTIVASQDRVENPTEASSGGGSLDSLSSRESPPKSSKSSK